MSQKLINGFMDRWNMNKKRKRKNVGIVIVSRLGIDFCAEKVKHLRNKTLLSFYRKRINNRVDSNWVINELLSLNFYFICFLKPQQYLCALFVQQLSFHILNPTITTRHYEWNICLRYKTSFLSDVAWVLMRTRSVFTGCWFQSRSDLQETRMRPIRFQENCFNYCRSERGIRMLESTFWSL